MPVGIEHINLYGGSLFLDLFKLAEVRERNMEDLRDNIYISQRSLNPLYEDAVTLAVNAAKPLLTGELREQIGMLVVGTETSTDYSKAISTYIHKALEITPNCVNWELKHACYGATAALNTALWWVAACPGRGKKALVIGTDFSRKHLNERHEFVMGGGAVAMIVSDTPDVLEIDLERRGYWTTSTHDTFRPTSIIEMGNSEESLYSYVDALEGAFDHYLSVVGEVDFPSYFKRSVYHSPFAGMTFQAHRTIVRRYGMTKKSVARAHWEEHVMPSLRFIREIGSAYASSTLVNLMALLDTPGEVEPGDKVSVFAYGSGSQGEFYETTVGPKAAERVQARKVDDKLAARREVSVDEYETLETVRESYVDQREVTPDRSIPPGHFEDAYEGSGLLVYSGTEEFMRSYEWT